MNNNEGSKGCKYAFLVDQQWFAANFAHLQAVNKMESVPVVLEWWLDRRTFDLPLLEKSQGQQQNFNCPMLNAASSSNNSSKVQCYCNKGFEGNPYLLEGCQGMYLIYCKTPPSLDFDFNPKRKEREGYLIWILPSPC